MKILSCDNTKLLAEKIVTRLGLESVQKEICRFPDGELSVKIYDELLNKEVLITHQLFPNVNDNLVQLLFMVNAVKRSGAKRIHLVIPYLSYSRMDHKTEFSHFISAACIASLLEAVGLSTLIAIDVHSSQIEGFFRIAIKNITLLDVFHKQLSDLKSPESIVVSPDVGGKVRIASVSNFLGSAIAVLHKQRDEQNNVSIHGIMGNVENKHCIILDDIIGSGQTINTAIDVLKQAGAKSIEVMITHNLLGVVNPSKIYDIASRVDKFSVSNSIVMSAANQVCKREINVVDISDPIIRCIASYL